jgi:hypothetical protein
MGALKTLLGLVILVAILVFGYWLYATYTSPSTDDKIWAQINSNLPDPLRQWSCEQLNSRMEEAEAPESCADVWQTAVTPSAETPLVESRVNRTTAPASETQPTAPATPVENARPSTEGAPINDY